MPQLQDVLGESGGEHIKANCCNTYTALEDTVLAVQGRKKSKLPCEYDHYLVNLNHQRTMKQIPQFSRNTHSDATAFFEDQSRPIAQKPPVFFRDLLLTIEKSTYALFSLHLDVISAALHAVSTLCYKGVSDSSRSADSNADGLFRVSGNETRVKALKAKIDARQYVNFDRLLEIPPSDGGCKVEDLISLMKTYLRSFKDPVIPSYQNDAYLQAAGVP